MMKHNLRPRPVVIPSTEPYWKAASEGRLDLPRYDGKWEPSPRPGSQDEVTWETTSRTGRVHTFSVSRFSPYDDVEAPYIVALVDLDDGPRVLTNLVEVAPEAVSIDMPVELTFIDVDSYKLPVFRPAP